jgi:hypothetical protein
LAITNPALNNSRHFSSAGRKKIRGGAVVLAEADRIFLERLWRPLKNFLVSFFIKLSAANLGTKPRFAGEKENKG